MTINNIQTYFGRFTYTPGSPVNLHGNHERGDFRVVIEPDPENPRHLIIKGVSVFGDKPVLFPAGTKLWAQTNQAADNACAYLVDDGTGYIEMMGDCESLEGCQLEIESPI